MNMPELISSTSEDDDDDREAPAPRLRRSPTGRSSSLCRRGCCRCQGEYLGVGDSHRYRRRRAPLRSPRPAERGDRRPWPPGLTLGVAATTLTRWIHRAGAGPRPTPTLARRAAPARSCGGELVRHRRDDRRHRRRLPPRDRRRRRLRRRSRTTPDRPTGYGQDVVGLLGAVGRASSAPWSWRRRRGRTAPTASPEPRRAPPARAASSPTTASGCGPGPTSRSGSPSASAAQYLLVLAVSSCRLSPFVPHLYDPPRPAGAVAHRRRVRRRASCCSAVLVCVGSPLVEELFFRGLFLRGLLGRLSGLGPRLGPRVLDRALGARSSASSTSRRCSSSASPASAWCSASSPGAPGGSDPRSSPTWPSTPSRSSPSSWPGSRPE